LPINEKNSSRIRPFYAGRERSSLGKNVDGWARSLWLRRADEG
jgi:hypothetical protein